MKNLKSLALAGALVLCAVGGAKAASRVVYNQALVNESGLAYNNTYTLDMGASILSRSNIDSLSMQAVYSSTTFSAATFTDGNKSTGTITVSSYTSLVGAQATDKLTVANTTYVNNNAVYFTLNGYVFAKGDLWNADPSSATTAINICTAINGYAAVNTQVSASTTALGVCTITSVSSGAYTNTYTLTTSSQAALSAGGATFSGGRDHAFLVISGQTLTQGTDFNAVTNASTTAKNISNGIQGNTTLAAIIASTWTTAGVVTATSTAVGSGTTYGWYSSTNAALPTSNQRLYGGSDSAINLTTDKITLTNHGLTTGLAVLFTKTAGTVPTGLTANVTYYAIRNNANTFQLSTTSTGAVAGSAIDMTAVTGGGSFTLTPLVIAGTPSFKWQGSNDNSNWNDVSVSSVTMSSLAPASTTWDFGTVNYRYVRLNVVAPTQGGISLVVTGIGKSN